MSENQQNDGQEDILPEESPITDGAAAAGDADVTDSATATDAADAADCADGTDSGTNTEAPETLADPETRYRWTYGEQQAYDSAHAAPAAAQSAGGKRGIWVYALIMTVVFALSFGILLAVLLAGKQIHVSQGTPQNDAVSRADMEPIENAKRSVVVIEVTTESGSGTGTGVVLNSGGYIATNHHVIDGAKTIRVTFIDGTQTEATVVGSSAMDDLAVVRVSAAKVASQLYPATFVSSTDDNYVGQTVYAIGTPGGAEFAFTTTKGIISYVNREVRQYNSDGTMAKKVRTIQTDAKVNPGNSGGPLVDTEGNVVGIVSMKLGNGYEGIGFAIPSDGALEILSAIIRDGNADSVNSSLSFRRPLLGIVGVYVEEGHTYVMDDALGRIVDCEGSTVEEIQSQITQSGGTVGATIQTKVSGVYVTSVSAGMGAEGKLQEGDIVLSVDGLRVSGMSVLANALNDRYVGDTVSVEAYRNGSTVTVDVVLSAQTAK